MFSKKETFQLILGLIGWVLLALNYPFENLLPTYAAF